MMAREKRAIFVPAIGTQFVSAWRSNITYKGFNYAWWTAPSFFNYRYALISAPFGIKNDIWWRDQCGYPKDSLLMTDSGGFQICSSAKNGKPAPIGVNASLRWQEKNSDIAFNLDVPLVTNGAFDICLKKSLANFTTFERNRENYDMKLYNILHGRNLREIETWYIAVKDFDFDGWGIGIKGGIYKQVFAYLMLHEKDAPNLQDNMHLFGTSSLPCMLALAMLSKHFGTALTFDSSSYNTGARFRSFNLPLDVRHKKSFGREAERMMANPCHCPVCSSATLEDLYSQTNPATPLLLSLHNLYQYIEVNKIINEKVDDEEAIGQYAESWGELELVQNVHSMLEEYDHGGYRSVYERFKDLIEKTAKKNSSEGVSFDQSQLSAAEA